MVELEKYLYKYIALHRWSNTFVSQSINRMHQKEKDRRKNRLCKRALTVPFSPNTYSKHYLKTRLKNSLKVIYSKCVILLLVFRGQRGRQEFAKLKKIKNKYDIERSMFYSQVLIIFVVINRN